MKFKKISFYLREVRQTPQVLLLLESVIGKVAVKVKEKLGNATILSLFTFYNVPILLDNVKE